MGESVSVVVLNYNHFEDTCVCLSSILNSDHKEYNIFLVDNNSTNNSVVRLQEWISSRFNVTRSFVFDGIPVTVNKNEVGTELVFLQSPDNNGYAAGNNIGIKYALQNYNPEYFWILNNDTIVDNNAMTALVLSFKTNEQAGFSSSVLLEYTENDLVQSIGGQYNRYTGANKSVGRGLRYQDIAESKFKIDYPNGASMMVKRQVIDEIGPMNENYFLYFEEIDWVTRAKPNGWKVVYAALSKVWHKDGGTVNKNGRSTLSDYYILRSRLLYVQTYENHLKIIIYISSLVFIYNRLRRKQFDRALVALKLLLNINFKPKFLG